MEIKYLLYKQTKFFQIKYTNLILPNSNLNRNFCGFRFLFIVEPRKNIFSKIMGSKLLTN